jgi:hypothetical protein
MEVGVMLKKVLVGTLVLGLSGALVVGAINRTNDRLEREVRGEDVQQGRQAEGLGQQNGSGQGAGQGTSQGTGQGERRQVVETNAPLGQGNQGNRQGNRDSGESVASLQESGVVTAVNEDALVVDTTSGETLIIEGRTWMYALDQGFQAEVGDQLTLSGFYEDAEWKANEIENLSNGMRLVIRGDQGRPLWAGQGRQG